ncbi:MAG: hypothetical protein M1453_00740 [Acidobacteria bacterium]|nr:hypothetical protein [Acidobacteriota bacterium]
MARRQCAYCGTFVDENAKQCPDCREMIPERIEPRKDPSAGRAEIRRGLLYTLLGAVPYYFASPGSPVTVPFPIPPAVTTYLLPLLMMLGLGFVIFGALKRVGVL